MLSLPIPQLQRNIVGAAGWVGRVDFYWEELDVAREADGRARYVDDELWADKVRQDAIEDVGVEVIRWIWRTAHAPDGEFAERLWRKLRRGRLMRRLDPPPLTNVINWAPQTGHKLTRVTTLIAFVQAG